MDYIQHNGVLKFSINNQIAASCRFAKDMSINYVAYNTNTATVEAKINLIKNQLYYAQEV
jgi:hypothetical protein